MDRTIAFLAGAGVGAGLAYVLDPQQGRRRRALGRDKAVSLAHKARDAAEVVAKDARNRARGLASGDLSVLAGGKRALSHPLSGSWSPSARALMGLAGGGLVLYGLTREAPLACVLGSVGLGLLAEGLTNAGVDDFRRLSRQAAEGACAVAGRAADSLGFGQHEAEQATQRGPERAFRSPVPAAALRG